MYLVFFFFFQAEDGIRDKLVTGVQTCALPISDEANRLTLQREAWLDFDGTGWFARDHVGGTLAQGWRFDVAAPFALEQAVARNSRRSEGGEALLITRRTNPELTGVEWRTPNVDL